MRSAGQRERAPKGAAGTSSARRETPARGAAEGHAAGQRRHHAPPKKRSYGPALGAFVVLALICLAAWWFFTNQDKQTEAVAQGQPASAPEQPAGGQTPAQPVEVPASEPTQPQASEPAPAAAAAELQSSEPAPEKSKPAPEDDIDLSTFPDADKLPGTSDEDWAQIQGWMASYIDPQAGAAGNRARAKLLERGRESFPAILNAFKRIDFSTEAGMRQGDLTQRLLTDICNGQNFDWHFSIEPAEVHFNEKVVRLWIKAWGQGRDSPHAWAKLTKTEVADAEKLFEKTGPSAALGGAPARASGLDDF